MTSALDPFRMGRFLGFDPMFDQLDRFLETATSKVTWPPYNLAKLTEHMYQLQFALAGFSKDEIRVRQEGDYLIVEGKLSEQPTGSKIIYRGISAKDFMVKFLLAEGVMVEDVEYDNGLLSIQVQKPVEGTKTIDFTIRTPLPRAQPAAVEVTQTSPTVGSNIMDEMIEASSN